MHIASLLQFRSLQYAEFSLYMLYKLNEGMFHFLRLCCRNQFRFKSVSLYWWYAMGIFLWVRGVMFQSINYCFDLPLSYSVCADTMNLTTYIQKKTWTTPSERILKSNKVIWWKISMVLSFTHDLLSPYMMRFMRKHEVNLDAYLPCNQNNNNY